MSLYDATADVGFEAVSPARPKTVAVLGVLVVAAALFSYLGAYCATGVLVQNDVLRAWAPGSDPRPRWMLFGFAGLLALFSTAAVLFRFASARQLKRIDEMENAEEPPPELD
jgi:hypothetical protein